MRKYPDMGVERQAFTIRLPTDLYLKVHDRAQGRGRTIGSQIEMELKKSLRRKAA